jgi:hypothetical protein
MPKDHRNMGIIGERLLQRLINEHLARGIVHMVITPDDMGETHGNVIHHHCQMVRRTLIRAPEDKVVQFFIVE